MRAEPAPPAPGGSTRRLEPYRITRARVMLCRNALDALGMSAGRPAGAPRRRVKSRAGDGASAPPLLLLHDVVLLDAIPRGVGRALDDALQCRPPQLQLGVGDFQRAAIVARRLVSCRRAARSQPSEPQQRPVRAPREQARQRNEGARQQRIEAAVHLHPEDDDGEHQEQAQGRQPLPQHPRRLEP